MTTSERLDTGPALAPDAERYEYTTYAPDGVTCRKCGVPIKRFERVNRVVHDALNSGPREVGYQHPECPR
ncbi:hypothetical protein [Streptomyces katsurahamanus]|uniref:HNH endonuclease n=1 Tax=Streptomyces katsurahamanus TaxID=2577098 RepID=A0ABW9P163_9ACTN|nr:hypothetical protein [Streptomyces katsurahamanus]MQS39208.1 hypothetical protein [Streptomyces katsurahamanus]